MAGTRSPTAILTDIEGTTTPIAFVRDVLFPYARSRLPEFLETHARTPEIACLIAETSRLGDGRPVLQTLLSWMDEDAKITQLKALQGLIWDEGYRAGTLKGELYPDVAPVLRRWHRSGVRLHVYSSGSESAQRLIFGHSTAGDLEGLFSAFFDTRIGSKRAPDSYGAIARITGLPAADFLFLSDVEAELDAAADAGMAVCQLVRANDGTQPSARHPVAADFRTIGVC